MINVLQNQNRVYVMSVEITEDPIPQAVKEFLVVLRRTLQVFHSLM